MIGMSPTHPQIKYKYIVSKPEEPGNEVSPGLQLHTGAH